MTQVRCDAHPSPLQRADREIAQSQRVFASSAPAASTFSFVFLVPAREARVEHPPPILKNDRGGEQEKSSAKNRAWET